MWPSRVPTTTRSPYTAGPPAYSASARFLSPQPNQPWVRELLDQMVLPLAASSAATLPSVLTAYSTPSANAGRRRTPLSPAPSPTLLLHTLVTWTVGLKSLASGVGGWTFSFLNEWQPARATSEVSATSQTRFIAPRFITSAFMHPASRPRPDHRFSSARSEARSRPALPWQRGMPCGHRQDAQA